MDIIIIIRSNNQLHLHFLFFIMSLVFLIWFYFVIEKWMCVEDGAVTVMLWVFTSFSFVFAFKEEKFVF